MASMMSGELEAAEEAVERGSNSFLEMEVKEHVTLLPAYLGRVGKGVTEVIASRILHYQSVYRGVLMAFSRVRVLNRAGQIFDELPHIHLNIEYLATVFRPKVEDVMCGEVNKVGVDHVGCLLYSCFNIAVTCSPLDQLSKRQQEKRLRSWCRKDFSNGERIWFIVSRVEVTGKLLSLRGEYVMEGEVEEKLEDEDVEKIETKAEMKKVKKKQTKKKRKRRREEEEEYSEPLEKKEKKQKRKR